MESRDSPIKRSNNSIDLSEYYVARKFKHGWLFNSQKNDTTIFLTKRELIQLGLIPNDGSTNEPIHPRRSTGAIVVPTARQSRRRRSANNDYRSDILFKPTQTVDIPESKFHYRSAHHHRETRHKDRHRNESKDWTWRKRHYRSSSDETQSYSINAEPDIDLRMSNSWPSQGDIIYYQDIDPPPGFKTSIDSKHKRKDDAHEDEKDES